MRQANYFMENLSTTKAPSMAAEVLKAAEVFRLLKDRSPGKYLAGRGLYLQIAGKGQSSWMVQ